MTNLDFEIDAIIATVRQSVFAKHGSQSDHYRAVANHFYVIGTNAAIDEIIRLILESTHAQETLRELIGTQVGITQWSDRLVV